MRETLQMAPETATPLARAIRPDTRRAGLLIATDGRPAADAAIIVGRSLAHRDRESHELLAVEDIDQMDEDRRGVNLNKHELHFRLAQQRARTTNITSESWPLSIAYGRPSSTIADIADQGTQRLIVVGLHVHSRADRLLGRETVLQLTSRASRPVLAVDSNRRTIPRRALLAIDFSPSSIAAAREALRIVGPSGVVYLAHVEPRIYVPFNAAPALDYGPTAQEQLLTLRRELGIRPGVETHLVVLQGDPTKELLAFADQEGVELIATGSHGFSPLRGAVIGAVPTAVVRAARCSVLVVPPMND